MLYMCVSPVAILVACSIIGAESKLELLETVQLVENR